MQILKTQGFKQISPYEYARGNVKINIALLNEELIHDIIESFLKFAERRRKPRYKK